MPVYPFKSDFREFTAEVLGRLGIGSLVMVWLARLSGSLLTITYKTNYYN